MKAELADPSVSCCDAHGTNCSLADLPVLGLGVLGGGRIAWWDRHWQMDSLRCLVAGGCFCWQLTILLPCGLNSSGIWTVTGLPWRGQPARPFLVK